MYMCLNSLLLFWCFFVGDIIISLNKLDLTSSNVNTILAAISGPMEVGLFNKQTRELHVDAERIK